LNILPKVDICILSWDRVEDTILAINSALSQKGIDSKVIVVDQGSSEDNLLKLRIFCEKSNRIILVCNRINLGVPGGRNQASYQGIGDYIVSLDNDAEFSDDYQLMEACKIMHDQNDLGIIAFKILRFGTKEDDITSWPYHEDLTIWSNKEFYTDRFVGAGHMIRRQVFEEVNGYDDKLFFLHEEVDFSKRVINAHYKIKYTSNVTICHKVSAEHRVSWTGKRWAFDVRNKTYLHIKFKTFLPTAIFHTGIMLWQGIKSGLIVATFQGFFQGFMLLPTAVNCWRKQKYLFSDNESMKYFEHCSPTSGMSVLERIKVRLKNVKPVVVKK